MRRHSLAFLLILLWPALAHAAVCSTREASSTASGAINGTSASVSLGTGVQDGDFIVVLLTLNNTVTLSTTSGYTQQISEPFGGGNDQTWVYTHVWHAGDPNAGLSFTWSGSQTGNWVSAAYTGAGSSPTLVKLAQANAASMTLTSPSITPTTSTDCLMMLYGTSGAGPFSSPSEGAVNIQSGVTGLFDFQLASGAATGNQTVTQGGSNLNTGIQIAIAPSNPTPTATPTPVCGIAPVGKDQITNNGAANCSGTMTFTPRTVGAGNALIVNMSIDGGASPKASWSTPTDNNGGSWTCSIYKPGSTAVSVATCWAPNYAAGSTTVSAAYSGGTGTCDTMGEMSEWKGFGSSITLDQVAQAQQNAQGNPALGPTGTLAAIPELSFAVLNADVPNVSATLASGNYTALTQSSATTFGTVVSGYQVTKVTTPLSVGWTLGSITTCNIQIVTLSGASGTCPGTGWFFP